MSLKLSVIGQKSVTVDRNKAIQHHKRGDHPNSQKRIRQQIAPIIFLSVLSVLLAVAAGLALRSALSESKITERALDEKSWYQTEYDDMLIQLTELEMAYEELATTHELLQEKLQEQQNEIAYLRRQIQQGLSPERIARYNDRIRELESILLQYQEDMSYIVADNEVLIRENQQMATSLNQVAERNQLLERENRILTEKVDVASKLQVASITISSFRNIDRMRHSDRARRVEAVEVCFGIRPNMLAEQGERMIYFQVTAPDNRVITDSPDSQFELHGSNIRYTFSEQLNWTGQELNICSHWMASRDLLPGYYQLVVFFDGNQYEPVFFELK